ncbi:MAG TPA: L-2-hydroxyglutarate oxidase [Candidatus Limnocylindrales bacterium]|jgi:L-2-hydroxyglutarate oxidase LhgO|nr:L-2-hydroxyglutarate oxidase [Candidatus Limnocylindrales bacterium]
MSDEFDTVVVGGGIVGLATARELLSRRPGMRLLLLEQEPELALHQSGHNSGVVHAGLYYAPGSAKARLCREGKVLLEGYCAERGIPLDHVGKLVVAVTEDELPRLADLETRARTNGVEGLEVVGPERIREIEPHAAGIRALWSPRTGIVDFRRVAHAYADDVRAGGGIIETGRRVTGLAERAGDVRVTTSGGEVAARQVVACAGLWADRVAASTGDPVQERIIPFRGDYYTLTPDAASLVRGLIYPVPDPRFPFLGVHFTRRIDGAVWAGPNAVLALARTGYRRRDLNLRDVADILRSRGFRALARRYWRTGLAEQWRDLSKRAFAAELRRYVPELRPEQLVFGPSGVRAQALDPDGTLVDDFRIGGSGRIVHVRNAPSPAATSSLAIARSLANEVQARTA